ncbi:MAG: hypothetical protein D3914_02185 [Candidatus Electrothrix sp. LOE2]|nr:hypothetical protein [Candidatus Electrothrix sp. LOE2]
MKNKIEAIVINALEELNQELTRKELDNPTLNTKLFGESGVLDSLSLVSFITDIESLISDEFDKNIILADEKAMSQRVSPFRTVETLTVYIKKLLTEEK